MKNLLKASKNISMLVVVAFAVSAAIFYACSKQDSTVNPAAEQQLSPQDLKINNTIKNFRDEVTYLRENPGYKSLESYTADSALWLLEATINYSHTFPNDYYGQLITDTLNLTLATNDAGEVDMNELAQKYDEMKAAISAVYHSKAIDDKGLVLVNLEDVSFKSDEVNIEVVAVTGERTNEIPNPPAPGGPFWIGDNWWYGEGQGLCSENNSDGSDAAKQLKEAFLLEFTNLENPTFIFGATYFDIEGGDPRIKRTDWNDIEDNHLDYLLYFATTELDVSDDTLCVEWQEMNLYYSFLKHMLFTYLPENIDELNGLELAQVSSLIGYEKIESINPLIIKYQHKICTYYGFRSEYHDGEEPSPL